MSGRSLGCALAYAGLRPFALRPLALACLSVFTSCAAQAEFRGLGDLPGGDFYSTAYGVSADGQVLVGRSEDGSRTQAVRWSADGILTSLGLPGLYSSAQSASADGGVIVGYFENSGHVEAFRWTAGGYTALGTGGYLHSQAMGVSADGNTLVGSLWGSGQSRAFVWTATDGIRILDDLPGGAPNSAANGVSANGLIAVGNARLAVGGHRAVMWDTTSGAATALGSLPGVASGWSYATAISADSQVIIGYAQAAITGSDAFRWTQAGGMQSLGKLSGYYDSYALALSADGGVIVGGATSATDTVATYWSPSSGLKSLAAWLGESGVDVGAWSLENAYGVSADGRTIVGEGRNPAGDIEAFIARAGTLVGVADLSASVASLHEAARLPGEIGRAALVMELPSIRGLQGWSAAPVYRRITGSRADLGGAALTWRAPGLALSASLGMVDAETSRLHADGEGDYRGWWLGATTAMALAELLEQPALAGLELALGVRGSRYDTRLARGFYNGASLQQARGTPDATEYTVLARLGWRQPLTARLELVPHLQWLYSHTEVDGYRESGGALAGRVSSQRRRGQEASAGLTLAWQLTPELALQGRYSLTHLTEDQTSGARLTLPGLGSFAAAEGDADANWHEFGLGLDWTLSERMQLSASLANTSGSDYPERRSAGVALHVGI